MMNLKKISYVALAGLALISSASINSIDVEAAAKKTKAKTSVSSKKKKPKAGASTTKKKATSSKVKSTSKKKSTGVKSTSKRKKTAKNRKTTSITHKQYTPPADPIKTDSLTMLVNRELVSWVPSSLNPGGLRVNSVTPDRRTRTAKVALNENFTYLPVSKDLISDMRKHISSILPDSINDYYVALNVKDKNYSFYITTIDKLPEHQRKNNPFVYPAEPYTTPKKGMEGDIVALWPSHGRYYKPATGTWLWQRPQLFQVTEDTHTMSFILPYVVPMLENAGAYVMLPRERDINHNEVIVDNDTNDEGLVYSQQYYKEMTGSREWTTGDEEGFIYDLPDFRDTENPFENGTYRQTTTVTSGKPSVAAWYADIPEDGEYAVYVSYKTLPNSTEDAHYTVNYSGGSREFRVNQTMGGGTWIYLGTFPLEAGYSDTEPVVTLSNLSKSSDKVLTADAVKIGGGMGNIARSPRRADVFYDPSTPDAVQSTDDDETDEFIDENPETNSVVTQTPSELPKGAAPNFKVSGLPRYLEGARYWMQWAGIPEYVYSPYHGSDDYKDDYTARGHWVNYLAGGSRVLPDKDGLNIPVDVAFALHSDAGKRADDSFVGTLGIYYTNGGDSYVDGTPRSNSRTLTDMVMRQMVNDIRQTWEPNWTRRSMWDKSYVEARVPEVPTTLIEFMSHQNFADMWYALDPAFRFTVSRSIYKAIGRFVSERKDRKFVVQPLPVKDFSIKKSKDRLYRLSWSPSKDKLEPTADPNKYLIFERSADELGFHLLGETTSTHFDVQVDDHEIHSFKIVAANEGGLSFPSEVLALREGNSNEKPVLIVNGFTRVSAPAHFSKDGMAGFSSDSDFGVPYVRDISFIGFQTEFNRNAGEAFGRSNGNYASQVIAGNTFDFPYIHGQSIAAAGKGFISASVGAVEAGDINLSNYDVVDLILGRQKMTVTGNGNTGIRHEAFSKRLQNELKSFVSHGGDLLVSGEYIGSDLIDLRSPSGSDSFAHNVLGVTVGDGAKTVSGTVNIRKSSGLGSSVGSIDYSNTLNDKNYIVQEPDILLPYDSGKSESFLSFSDTGNSAGVLTRNGKSNTAVMSIPFESIQDKASRDRLMKDILNFLEQ
ncbi:MAG: xanthan lyase [Bacteroides sp.]|nr:xanthan lyase [Bacteroides sp.]